MGMKGVKRYKLPVMKSVSPGNVTHSMVTTVNNTVTYYKLPRQ